MLGITWVWPCPQLTVLDAEPKALGRAEQCSTVLAGPETSRFHALVWREGRFGMIRDGTTVDGKWVRSTNGVFVNGVSHEQAALEAGAVVRVGEGIGLVAWVNPDDGAPPFHQIVQGWFGGDKLRSSIEPLRLAVKSADLSILVRGETGTGKEGVCSIIHLWSERRGDFVAINCAAFPQHLIESELFGYKRGAFSGAERDKLGLIQRAHGGTLLLDEVGDMPLETQAKLLRVLQQREVLPLGGTTPEKVDVLVVAATHRDLEQLQREGKFRHDLFARLNGHTVRLPPLRERREDIVPLFVQLLFSAGCSTLNLEPRLLEALTLYEWPGNARELATLAKSLYRLHPGEQLLYEHLPETMRPARAAEKAPSAPPHRAPTDDPQQLAALLKALAVHGGKLQRAAKAIGISRSRAYRLLEQGGMTAAMAREDDDAEADH